MKTINLTDDQFNTLFHFVNERVEDIIDRSVQFLLLDNSWVSFYAP